MIARPGLCFLSALMVLVAGLRNASAQSIERMSKERPYAVGAVLFVHGLFGDHKSSFSGAQGFWGDLMHTDKVASPSDKVLLSDYDIFSMSFDTFTDFRIDQHVKTTAARIRESDMLSSYDHIVIVAHSLGGLISLGVLNELNETGHAAVAGRISGVVFLGVPYAGVTSPQSLIGALTRKAVDVIAPELVKSIGDANGSTWASQMEGYWAKLKQEAGPNAVRFACVVETKPFKGTFLTRAFTEIVVPQRHALRDCPLKTNIVELQLDHSEVAKPNGNAESDFLYTWVKKRIEYMRLGYAQDPSRAMNLKMRLERLRGAFAPEFDQYIRRVGAAEALKALAPDTKELLAIEFGNVRRDMPDSVASTERAPPSLTLEAPPRATTPAPAPVVPPAASNVDKENARLLTAKRLLIERGYYALRASSEAPGKPRQAERGDATISAIEKFQRKVLSVRVQCNRGDLPEMSVDGEISEALIDALTTLQGVFIGNLQRLSCDRGQIVAAPPLRRQPPVSQRPTATIPSPSVAAAPPSIKRLWVDVQKGTIVKTARLMTELNAMMVGRPTSPLAIRRCMTSP